MGRALMVTTIVTAATEQAVTMLYFPLAQLCTDLSHHALNVVTPFDQAFLTAARSAIPLLLALERRTRCGGQLVWWCICGGRLGGNALQRRHVHAGSGELLDQV